MMLNEMLETEICVWKVETENKLAAGVDGVYTECILCNGYDTACRTYLGQPVLTVVPYIRGVKERDRRGL